MLQRKQIQLARSLICLFFLGHALFAADQAPPNILLIMCDQLVPMLTGAYGHPVVKTPHLERLASRGVRFDAAYSPCPICAPARACLLTGTFTSTNRVYDNAAALDCDLPTICHYLANLGYDTALSGKMHFVGPDQRHGFRERFTPNIYPADFQWTKSRDQKVPRPHATSYLGKSVKVGVNTQGLVFDEKTQTEALAYLDRHRNVRANAPFFLCVSFHHPHEPFCPPKKYWDLYRDEEIVMPEFPDKWRERLSIMDRWLMRHSSVDRTEGLLDRESLTRVRRAYYALVSYIDDKVGDLLTALDTHGLRDNTLVLFTSDHGDMLLEKGMVQKRGFYEYASRVPLILAFPDGRHAGTRRPEPVSLIDLLPTLLHVVQVPPADRIGLEGQSLMPLIEGTETKERMVFSENHSEGMHATCFMVRKNRYKYIYIHGHEGQCQLFDLKRDPHEWDNLVGQEDYQEIADSLRRMILHRFNPDEIERDLRRDLARRRLIHRAMQRNEVDWSYSP